ncbi:hypothetical protein CK218_19425 [Mesorhizobium sp. WSM3879]|nr:hypothetical protein CK221_17370 [Mesorhizobium sp. WSM3868]PBB79520.1 hypothetical protein CK218_19425 [Mesorhizobium sp. WSM3879]
MAARAKHKKPPGPGPSGKYEGANHADLWRKRMTERHRWRLTPNAVVWTLVVIAMTVSISLIAIKAR